MLKWLLETDVGCIRFDSSTKDNAEKAILVCCQRINPKALDVSAYELEGMMIGKITHVIEAENRVLARKEALELINKNIKPILDEANLNVAYFNLCKKED